MELPGYLELMKMDFLRCHFFCFLLEERLKNEPLMAGQLLLLTDCSTLVTKTNQEAVPVRKAAHRYRKKIED